MRKKFMEILQTDVIDKTNKEKAAKIGIEIEECLHSKFRDLKDYGDKARSIVFNLKDAKNPRLRIRLLYGTLTPWDIVTMDPKDLASESKKQEREEAE